MNTTISAPPLNISRLIAASVEETWQAWTNAELLGRWFAPGPMRAEVLALNVKKGGSYRIRMHDEVGTPHTVQGIFEEIVPQQRIVMTWAWEENESGGTSKVTVSFTPRDEQTELQILHEGLPDQDSVARHTEGWEGCLANLVSRIGDF